MARSSRCAIARSSISPRIRSNAFSPDKCPSRVSPRDNQVTRPVKKRRRVRRGSAPRLGSPKGRVSWGYYGSKHDPVGKAYRPAGFGHDFLHPREVVPVLRIDQVVQTDRDDVQPSVQREAHAS